MNLSEINKSYENGMVDLIHGSTKRIKIIRMKIKDNEVVESEMYYYFHNI